MVIPGTGSLVDRVGTAVSVPHLPRQVVTVQIRVDIPQLAVEAVAFIETYHRMSSRDTAPEHGDAFEADGAVDGEAIQCPADLRAVLAQREVELSEETGGKKTVMIDSVGFRITSTGIHRGRNLIALIDRLAVDIHSIQSDAHNSGRGGDVRCLGCQMREQRNVDGLIVYASKSVSVSPAVGVLTEVEVVRAGVELQASPPPGELQALIIGKTSSIGITERTCLEQR